MMTPATRRQLLLLLLLTQAGRWATDAAMPDVQDCHFCRRCHMQRADAGSLRRLQAVGAGEGPRGAAAGAG